MVNFNMQNPIKFIQNQILNYRRGRMEQEFIATVSKILQETMKLVVADNGLITSTGRSQLEETYGLSIFEEMSRDSQVKAALSVKKFAVLSGKWEVTPFDDSEAAKKHADFIKYNLEELLGDTGLGLEPVMTSFAYGRSICEKVYKVEEKGKYKGKYILAKLKPKNPGFIDFEMDKFNNIKWIVSVDQLGNETKVRPDKVIHYAWDTEFDNPFGRSDLTSCWTWYWAKKTIYKYFLIFCDKYASAIPVIEVEKALTSAQETSLDNAAKDYHLSNFLKLPRGVKLQLHQNNGTAGPVYLAGISMCDSQIARAILAQTLTINENQKTGTHAQAKVHKETLDFILSKVQNDIEKHIVREQIIKQLIDLNFPDAEGYPRFSFQSYDTEFMKSLSDLISNLCNTKDVNGNAIVEPTEEWIRQRLHLPPRDEKEFPLRDKPIEWDMPQPASPFGDSGGKMNGNGKNDKGAKPNGKPAKQDAAGSKK